MICVTEGRLTHRKQGPSVKNLKLHTESWSCIIGRSRERSTVEYQNQLVTSRSENKSWLGLECKSVKKQDDFLCPVSLIYLQLCGEPSLGKGNDNFTSCGRLWHSPRQDHESLIACLDQLLGPAHTTPRHTSAMLQGSQHHESLSNTDQKDSLVEGLITQVLRLAS